MIDHDDYVPDYDEPFTCPVCRGTQTIQPDRHTPAEPCPRCVNPDENG